MSRALWKYRREITVEHLGNSFQQQVLSGGEQQYKVLNAFLKQVPPTFRHFPSAVTVSSTGTDVWEDVPMLFLFCFELVLTVMTK